MNKDQSVDLLMQEGLALLAAHRHKEALEVGRKLKRMRHSSAFEIIALAYLRLGKLKKAIATLEEGVAKAGRAWVLWELLGNYYSDDGQYDAAEKAHQEALIRERCDKDVVKLNRAIAFDRAGKPGTSRLKARRFRRLFSVVPRRRRR